MKVYIIFLFSSFLSQMLFAQNTILDQAEKLLGEKEVRASIDLLNNNRDELDQYARFYFLLGKAFYEEKLFDKAILQFEQSIAMDENQADYYYWKGSASIEQLNHIDNFFKKGKYADKAKTSLLKAIELNPQHTDARIRLANYYLNAPLIAGGSIRKAKDQASEIERYDKAAGLKLQASIFLKEEEYDKAEAIYLEILNSELGTKNTYYWLSYINVKKEDYQKAFYYCDRSIEKYPDYYLGHYQYAKIAAISKMNIDQGIDYCIFYINQTTSADLPKKHWAYYRLAMLEKARDNKTATLLALQNALELKPGFKEANALLESLESN